MRWAAAVPAALAVWAGAAAASAETVRLEDAARSGVYVELHDQSSYSSVKLFARNDTLRDIDLVAEPGVVLENEFESQQDVTLAAPLRVHLAPGEIAARTLATYCIRPHDGPPTSGAEFHVRGFERDVGAFVRRHPCTGSRPDPAVQQRVWDLIERRGHRA